MLMRNCVYFSSAAAAANLEAVSTNVIENINSGEILMNFLHEDDQVTVALLFYCVLKNDV